jgi:two-component system sensor histidine kinase VicK
MNTLNNEEMLRLAALEQYEEAFHVESDPAIDDIVALAAQICNTPMAAISLIGPDAIHFQSRFGPGPSRLPRGIMPCESCIHGDSVYEITDARYHKDFRPDGIMIAGRAYRF